MNPTELKRVKLVFAEAVEKAGAERQAYLDRACGGDQNLRAEVQAFLSAAERAGDALDSPTIANPDAGAETLDSGVDRPGSIIGPYKLLQLIGEGGFGSVFMAEQEQPVRRRVALKIIKLGMDTKQVIARFEAERQALAMMDHPNIARVFDAGATVTGRPYFVMELVRGIPITEYCDVNRLTTNQRLELFVTVCHAIQHAHQKGIIHRDIKPSNVLVTLHDGIPVPKVIDFGIAKATNSRLTEKTLFTEFRQFIGTPAYVSPEQAEMSGLDIDTRSDIYSLGVLLYELLTGTTPFDPKQLNLAAYNEIQRIIREVDPPKPSTRLSTLGQPISKLAANRNIDPKKLPQTLRGDLDWIVMKALEKDRTRRYETPNELARDISRHLNDQTIEACPPSMIYRTRRLVRRNRIGVFSATAIVAMAALAIGTYIRAITMEQRKTSIALIEATTAQTEADRRRTEAVIARADADRRRNEAVQATTRATDAEARANEHFVRAAIMRGRAALESTQSGRRFDSLALLAAAAKISPTAEVRSQAIACMGLVDARITRVWGGTIATADTSRAGELDFAADFNFDCSAYADRTPTGQVLIRRIPQADEKVGALIAKLPCRVSMWWDVAFSPYGQFISAGCDDNHVRVFKLEGELVLDIPQGSAGAFTPDGKGFAARKQDGPVVIYDLKSGEAGQPLWPGEKSPWLGSNSIAFSPDGSKLAMWNVNSSGDVIIGDIASGKTVTLHHPRAVIEADWSPDGAVLATAMPSVERKGVYLWDINARPEPVPRIIAGPQSAFSVRFSHGGDLVASSGWDGTTCLMDSVSGEKLVQLFFSGHLRFTPDDRTLTSRNGAAVHIQVEVAPARERRIVAVPPRPREHVAFSPDGTLMACGGEDRVRFWNLSPGVVSEPPADLMMGAGTTSVAFNPDGAGVMVGADNGLWGVPISTATSDAQLGAAPARQIVTIGPKEPIDTQSHNGAGTVQFANDGAALALVVDGQQTSLFNMQNSAKLTPLAKTRDLMYSGISNDAKWVATGNWIHHGDQRVGVWDAHSGALKCLLPVPMDGNVAFSPDNKWLVTGSPAEFRFWEVGSWQSKHAIPMSSERLGLIAFSGDSRMVALSAERFGVRLLDLATMADIATLEDNGDERPLGFSRDGSLLATYGSNNTFRLWDLRVIREQLKEMGLDWGQPPLPPRQPTSRFNLTVAEPKPTTRE